MTGHTPWAEIRHKRDDPVEIAMDALRRVDPATVVEPGDIRMAFEAAHDAGWHIARVADTEFLACQRTDGTWRAHSNMSIHMGGCTPLVVVTKKWTP